MPGLKPCEFFLLRYVPDAVKGEFVNIGVVLLGPAGTEMRFSRDLARVRCMDPDADLEMLSAVEAELRRDLAQGESRERLLKKLHDSFSNTLQLSAVTGCLAEDPQAEADLLARHYLETAAARKGRSDRGAGPRRRLFTQMRSAFESQGVWELMTRAIRAEEFTLPGDPLEIDCGYRPHGNGLLRMFHAVSLQGSAESAKVLAYSYPQLRQGLRRKHDRNAELTAVVEDGLDRGRPEIAFGMAALEQSEILIAPASELPRLAQRAREELKA
jgi:hypothetical protein